MINVEIWEDETGRLHYAEETMKQLEALDSVERFLMELHLNIVQSISDAGLKKDAAVWLHLIDILAGHLASISGPSKKEIFEIITEAESIERKEGKH